jgi:hypothetical protein
MGHNNTKKHHTYNYIKHGKQQGQQQMTTGQRYSMTTDRTKEGSLDIG